MHPQKCSSSTLRLRILQNHTITFLRLNAPKNCESRSFGRRHLDTSVTVRRNKIEVIFNPSFEFVLLEIHGCLSNELLQRLVVMWQFRSVFTEQERRWLAEAWSLPLHSPGSCFLFSIFYLYSVLGIRPSFLGPEASFLLTSRLLHAITFYNPSSFFSLETKQLLVSFNQ